MKRWGALALTTVLAVGCFGGPAYADDVSSAPIGKISGIAPTNGVAVDAAGVRYVLTDTSVQVFEATQNGAVAPVREITGPQTKIADARAIALAPSGRIYVAAGSGASSQVLAFGPNATGNQAPAVRIRGANTGLDQPSGLAFDASGGFYVTNRASSSLLYFAPGSDGNVAPAHTVAGGASGLSAPVGVAVAGSAIHVANAGDNSVTTYAPSNNTPIQRIAGGATGLTAPYAVAADAQGYVYVTNRTGTGASVVVFTPPPSGGDTVPVTRLIGAATQLDDPSGVAVDTQRRVVVTDEDAALTFPALVTAPPPVPPLPPGPTLLAPSAVNDLTVKGQTTAKKRKVVWKAPTSTGGAPILNYQVTVMKGTKTLFAKKVSGFKVVLKRKKLVVGKLTVTVTAFNSVGQGKRTTKTFKVEKPGTTKKK